MSDTAHRYSDKRMCISELDESYKFHVIHDQMVLAWASLSGGLRAVIHCALATIRASDVTILSPQEVP